MEVRYRNLFSLAWLVAGALSLSSQAQASRYPSVAEIIEVQKIAVQLEIDTNEAYYLSIDHQTGGGYEDEALGDLNDLKVAAYNFSESVTSSYSNPLGTQNDFIRLNGAFLEAEETFYQLTAYNHYQSLFESIAQNMRALRYYYLALSPGYHYPYPRIVIYPRHSYYYPYWRYPTHWHHRHYHPSHYRNPWDRYSGYRDPRWRYRDHRRRPGHGDWNGRHDRWQRDRDWERGDRRDDRRRPDDGRYRRRDPQPRPGNPDGRRRDRNPRRPDDRRPDGGRVDPTPGRGPVPGRPDRGGDARRDRNPRRPDGGRVDPTPGRGPVPGQPRGGDARRDRNPRRPDGGRVDPTPGRGPVPGRPDRGGDARRGGGNDRGGGGRAEPRQPRPDRGGDVRRGGGSGGNDRGNRGGGGGGGRGRGRGGR